MIKRNWLIAIGSTCVVGGFSVACGPSAAQLAAVESLPQALKSGSQVVLYTPPGVQCAERLAYSEKQLEQGGIPLHDRKEANVPLAIQVIEPTVEGSQVTPARRA